MIAPRWRVDCVVGARPNFMKIAPILRAFSADGRFATRLLHTGQHYDAAMSAVFFEALDIPAPDVTLDAGSGGPAEQTGRAMIGLEATLSEQPPDLLVVVGDVNSTLAAALVGAKLGIPIAHVEAGLRSFDRSMPEEINRLVVDRLADLLLTTERAANAHLLAEGAKPEQIAFVGNVMIDSLRFAAPRAVPAAQTLAAHGFAPQAEGFGLLTLHRPATVDDGEKLARLIAALGRIAARIPLFFPVHPRTRAALARLGGLDIDPRRLCLAPPVGYLEMVGLIRDARFVVTDSGGVQEETTALGVPCFTFRDNTERPATIDCGGNRLVGTDPAALEAAIAAFLRDGAAPARLPELWDGAAAPRIAAAIAGFLERRTGPPVGAGPA